MHFYLKNILEEYQIKKMANDFEKIDLAARHFILIQKVLLAKFTP